MMQNKSCCFFGHREINETDELRERVTAVIERLIKEDNVDTFLFGSKSRFDSLSLELVTELKQKYPHIRRIYVRAEFPVISDRYMEYLLNYYDETYYPEKINCSGRAAYVERNCEMIDKSRFCVIHYNESEAPVYRKSGTKKALDYATVKGRKIMLV